MPQNTKKDGPNNPRGVFFRSAPNSEVVDVDSRATAAAVTATGPHFDRVEDGNTNGRGRGGGVVQSKEQLGGEYGPTALVSAYLSWTHLELKTAN